MRQERSPTHKIFMKIDDAHISTSEFEKVIARRSLCVGRPENGGRAGGKIHACARVHFAIQSRTAKLVVRTVTFVLIIASDSTRFDRITGETRDVTRGVRPFARHCLN